MARLHSSALFLPLASDWLLEEFLFGCVLWISCRFCLEKDVSVPSVFLMLGTFSLPPVAQTPSVGGCPSGHIFPRQLCCLRLTQGKGLCSSSSLKSELQPLSSSIWVCFPVTPVADGADTPAETSTIVENLQTISYSGLYFTDFLFSPS